MKWILLFFLFALFGCSNDRVFTKENIIEEVWTSDIEMGSYLCNDILDGKYFFAIYNNTLKSIDFENGKTVLWSQNFSNGVENAPFLYEGCLYLADLSGDIFCIDAISGSNIWRQSLSTQVISPLKVENLGGEDFLFVPAYDKKLHVFDPVSGGKKWDFSTDNFLNAQPAISEDRKYLAFGNCGGKLYIINDTGILYKTIELNSPLTASPVIIGGRIYIGSHSDGIFCVSLNDGGILQRYFEESDINFMSSPFSNGDVVYFVGSDNIMYAIDAKSMYVTVFFRANSQLANFLFIDDYFFLSERSGMMYFVNIVSKDIVWQYDGGVEIFATCYKNYILTGDSQGIITKMRVR